MGEHTPGPYRIGDAGGTIFGPKSNEPAPVTIATLPPASRRVSQSERRANAQLLAAAPDLLAACRRVLRAIEWSETGDRLAATEQAALLRAAIRAAEAGRNPIAAENLEAEAANDGAERAP